MKLASSLKVASHQIAGIALVASLVLPAAIRAEDTPKPADQNAELRQELDRLKERMDALQKSAGDVQNKASDSLPAAAPGGPFRSFTERIMGATSIGTYGEVLYQAPHQGGTTFSNNNTADAYRVVLFVGHDFNDWLRFFTEIEFEHGGDEVSVEQLFIDIHPHKAIGLQVGKLLVPVSHINKYHEPTTFWSARRPLLDRVIRPTTWSEPGIGVYGQPSDYFSYELQLVDGFRADRFSGSEVLREGRQEGREALANDLAVAGRLELYPTESVTFGIFGYYGGADQNLFQDCSSDGQVDLGNTTPGLNCPINGLTGVRVGMLSTDLIARANKAELRIGQALGYIRRSGRLSRALNGDTTDGAAGNEVIPSRFWGWNIEGSYDVLAAIAPKLDQSGHVFVRYEDVDTQSKVASGLSKDPARIRRQAVFGFAYLPHPGVVLKADYEMMFTDTRDDPQQFNLAVGWNF